VQPKQPKPKTCKARGCVQQFIPRNSMHTACGPACAHSIVRAKREQEEQRKRSDERKADRAKRETLKSRADWAKEAQAAFNAFIRARDSDQPCISCVRHHQGQYHAGHYLSRGARPELAMHEDNCHKQCAPCNTHLSGNLVLYRVNLIQKIGLARVEALEGPHMPLKLTIEDLRAIRDTYRAKANELMTETVPA
jgi:hypothetical protein